METKNQTTKQQATRLIAIALMAVLVFAAVAHRSSKVNQNRRNAFQIVRQDSIQ